MSPARGRRRPSDASATMMLQAIRLIALAIALHGSAHAADSRSVLSFHGGYDRSGSFLVPGLTAQRARGTHIDAGFQAVLAGHLYAQPLFLHDPETNAGILFAATESNDVHALEATTGRELWRRSLGPPVSRSALRCGNINPLGVTGTPVIDPETQAIYAPFAKKLCIHCQVSLAEEWAGGGGLRACACVSLGRSPNSSRYQPDIRPSSLIPH